MTVQKMNSLLQNKAPTKNETGSSMLTGIAKQEKTPFQDVYFQNDCKIKLDEQAE